MWSNDRVGLMFTDLLLKVLRLLFADKKTGELQVKYSREITMTGFSEEEDIENRKNKLKHLCHEVVDNSGFDARDITGYGFAGLRGEVHGHVAVLYPLSCGESGKWGEVPYIAHVGKPPNGIRKVSESFIVSGQRPDYYLFKFKEL